MRATMIVLSTLCSITVGAHAADAPKPASPRDAATRRFDESPTGKPLVAKVRAAEARRDRLRDGGTAEERGDAARAVLDARAAYRVALQAALDADPALKAPAATDAKGKPKPADPPATPAPLNAAILAYAKENFGKQVGNGECWTLAERAYRAAGAKAPDAYVWGRPLAKDEEVIPGDVIQFASAKLESNGSWIVLGTPQHTSIVAKVVSPGVFEVLHQNVGGKTVTGMTIDVSTKTAGDLIIYRAIPGAGHKG